ncbi:MAG: helix-turn-helix domain-containing protein [Alphaproteobacteria bacterium]|nr:helix-turn-helix domain-containing protein [Alphaproteobacteria bacterium]
MLKGVRIYTSDVLWRQILGDFGAILLDAPTATDINFDTIDVPEKITPIQLKALILGAVDNSGIIARLLGPGTTLPRMQGRVVALLYKSGGMRAAEIKDALGYSPNAATHTVDTAIYQLRRMFGRNFIINDHGVYRLGKL